MNNICARMGTYLPQVTLRNLEISSRRWDDGDGRQRGRRHRRRHFRKSL